MKALSMEQVADIIRKYVISDPVYGLQGVETAAVHIVLATVETDD